MSVRNVFRLGLFLSRKNKKKKALDPATGPTEETHASPELSRRPELLRRTSRLEMGIPIEDVFSGIQFATIDKPTSSHAFESGVDVIAEEPYDSSSETQPGPSTNDVMLSVDDANFNHNNNPLNCCNVDGISEDLT